jgi:hypothetical protein
MRRLLLLTAFAMLAFSGAFAQGITTSAIQGQVTDAKGEALPGATVVAVHTPSGTQYASSTRDDGRFTIPNARVGGPYTITVTFIGYEQKQQGEVYLSLGNPANVNVQLSETGTELGEVVVSASRNDVFNTDRTGASTNVNNRTIQSVPTINRGLRDFTKLSPLANTSGNGTSFAGANNRYNQFSIDGLVSNDVFGLTSSGTNGGQTGIEPISLDAIEEFQINIAPYDVRQGGFTGGGINAVTRSGSNTFQGSVYYFGNNESLVGGVNPNSGEDQDYPNYKDYQAGFRLGGPIVKDKLFFFVNGEITRQSTPLAFQPGSAESNITLAEVNRVLAVLDDIAPGYDPGAFGSISDETNSDKILAKIDWNINNRHKLTIRHSYTYGENIDNSRSANQLRFYNNGQYFPSTTNSSGIELNSIFGTQFANRFLLGYTRVRDDRDALGNPFPYTLINLGAPTGRTIVFGGENSSVANQLDQDIFTLTNDFTIYKGKHTITIGTHNELYSFYNLFVQNIFGNYAFRSLENFETQSDPIAANRVNPTFYRVGYSFDPNDGPLQMGGGAEFKAMQLGLYAQDEIQFSNDLKVTAGLRIDLPIFGDSPESNEAFNTAYGEEGKTGTVPDSKILWSPRVGANWDVFGNKSLQVRGGVGIFTGRVPFVWVSNQFSNNGQLNGTYSVGNSGTGGSAVPLTNGIVYTVDPFNQQSAESIGATAGRGAINVIDKDFRFPQVFRGNIAVDKQLPWGLVATVEAIYSKTYNNVNFINLNRNVDEAFTFDGPDQRPRYLTGRQDANFEEIVKLDNTNKGYSYNYVVQLQKQLDKGFSGSIAYSYGDAKDLNSGTSSVAYSNWQFVNQVNGLNDLSLARANFSAGSRVMGLISYRKEYLKGLMATQVSLFYNGQSGQPLSYVYNNDFNNDGTTGNDLIYVPRDASEINLTTIPAAGSNPAITPEEQWEALNAFIEGDDYLKDRRGKYAERNGARLPFQHQFDFRILQDIAVKVGNTTNRIQISLDILNVGNLLNSDWGKQYTAANQQFPLISYEGLTGSTPRYQYRPALTNGEAYSAFDLSSRWRAQLGLRYIFN